MKRFILILVAVLSLLALTSCDDRDCNMCENGWTNCPYCEPISGSIAEMFTGNPNSTVFGVILCEVCQGKGHVNGVDCTYCSAMGYSLCFPCHGTGVINCPFCNRFVG